MRNEKITNIQSRTGINWATSITMVVFHIGAVTALFMFTWQALVVSLLLWWVAGSLGVGMGYHRLLTHRGFKTPKAVEYFLTFCGLLALEAGPIAWVVTHRIHHAHTDAPGDPHTPRDGNWWAHMGWILKGTAQRYNDSVRMRYAPDLMKDPVHRWFENILRAARRARGGASGRGRLADAVLGHLPARDIQFPHDVARQLGDAPVGLAPFRDDG
jgi:fatty-acid desaturase